MVYTARTASTALIRSVTDIAACLAVAAWLLLAQVVAAESPPVLSAPTLLPKSDPGSVELIGLDHLVHVTDAKGETLAGGVQRYSLHNDGDQSVEVTLIITPPSETAIDALNATYDGTTLELAPSSPDDLEITLDAGQTADITISYESKPLSGHLVHWRWDLAPFHVWGQVPSSRLTFRFPEPITDETLLSASPPNYVLEAKEAVWNLPSPQAVELTFLAPATWRELARLRASDDAQALGQLYLAIASDAAEIGLPDRVLYSAGIGELLTALKRAPDDAMLRTTLAKLYATQADAQPELRLFYLSLAIQQLEAIAPAEREPEIIRSLGELGLEAALAAEEAGNPSLALEHLQQAERFLGGDLVDQRQEVLALRLALSLAERGRLREALEAIQDKVSPQTQDALLRYAPPFASVVTTVTMTSEMRMAEQRFRLYAPTAEATRHALQELAAGLDAKEPVEAHLTFDQEVALLTVEVSWSHLGELGDLSQELADSLDQEELLSAVVASPWTSVPETYMREQNLWRTSVRYQEHVDLRHLGTLWEGEDSLAHWQAVEIEAALAPGSEPTYEQRLAHHALAQQRDVWRDMPRSSYWIYQVVLSGDGAPKPVGRVAFGEAGQAGAMSTAYDPERLAVASATGIALMVVLLSLVVLSSHTPPKHPLP